jgi:hypothetical protein
VLNRFLARRTDVGGVPVVGPDDCKTVAKLVAEIDEHLGASLAMAFKDRKTPIPIDDAMAIIDLQLQQRTEPAAPPRTDA